MIDERVHTARYRDNPIASADWTEGMRRIGYDMDAPVGSGSSHPNHPPSIFPLSDCFRGGLYLVSALVFAIGVAIYWTGSLMLMLNRLNARPSASAPRRTVSRS